MAAWAPGRTLAMNGNEVVAYAVKQCNVDVVAAYPITPQTIIVEAFSTYVADGLVDTRFICVESEHSAMSACIGASLMGARVFTATSSQGLALMHEALYAASGLRCPIVMAVVNRALSAPINIHCDHSDMMGSRDCGWVQIFVENVQEAYDFTIQSFRIAEHPDVLLPVAVNLDGFTISHCVENFITLTDEEVLGFIQPKRTPVYWLNPDKPITVGALTLPDYYYEVKRQQVEAMENAYRVFLDTVRRFADLTGRRYNPIEVWGSDDADAAIILLGSTVGLMRSIASRYDGRIKIVFPRLFRPFPSEDLKRVLEDVKVAAVMDRAIAFGAPLNPLASSVASTILLEGLDTKLVNFVYGLGGRDLKLSEAEYIANYTLKAAETGVIDKPVSFIGVRE
jgi:pyruvate ferredoxin oxidoreductase alpha subunit